MKKDLNLPDIITYYNSKNIKYKKAMEDHNIE